MAKKRWEDGSYPSNIPSGDWGIVLVVVALIIAGAIYFFKWMGR